MKVFDDIRQFTKQAHASVTIGTFDGVHLGHQEILKRVVNEAKSSNGTSILITFWPHPRFVVDGEQTDLKLLSTFDEKVELLNSLDLDYIIKIPFTPEFSNLSPADFVASILVEKIGTKKLFIGYDHRFGKNREGDIHFLQSKAELHGYQVFEISRQEIDYIGISSTKIRKALLEGDVKLANSLLGRPYGITGSVIDGQKVGRQLGFPTANIHVEESYKLLPGDGAYAIHADVNGTSHQGMLNIGFKPTVDGKRRTIEAHLFNFDENIYGQEITISFVQALRKEIAFKNLEELKIQLERDKNHAQSILK